MGIWASLWQLDTIEGKAHKSVIRYLSAQITIYHTMEHIYRLVVRWGVEDDMDALATSRALWAIRNNLRKAVNGDIKAISA